jgi:serine phosphatase RsbU (regulator of sigma subunit)
MQHERLLGEGGAGAVRLARLRRAFWSSWWRRVLTVALAAWLLDVLLALAGSGLPEPLAIIARVVLVPGVLWLGWRLLRWLSRRLLWRIRTKLILSYLFIALVPVVLLGVFFLTAAVLMLVLSASRLVTSEVERAADTTRATAVAALADLPQADDTAGRALAARLAPVRSLHPGASWTLLRERRVAAAEGQAPRALPAWWKGEPYASLVKIGEAGPGPGRSVLRVVVTAGPDTLLVDVPADRRLFAALEERAGIHVLQPEELDGTRAGPEKGPVVVEVQDQETATRVRLASDSGLHFVALPPQRDWQAGGVPRERFVPLVFRFQPLDFVRRLAPELPRGLSEWRSLGDILLFALGIVGAVFLVMYAVALALGLLLARQITRGVHELSVGTHKLRQGAFGHVIPTRSRDQLGELAESFNEMSRDIQQLMRAEAEKERLEEELRIARRIQMSLLPGDAPARMAGLRIAALCLPAAEVGGDYYDLLPLSPTRMGVLVADVSGKGTSAALYMAELKGLVLSLSRICDSPGRLLAEANRILWANMDSRSFVTMTYAIVDTEKRCMRHARAGHNPVIHLEARTGRTRVLAPAGLGLGLDAGDRFESVLQEEETPLAPGDVFLFFTDGLSEAMNEGSELFGEGRLRRILEESEGLGSEHLKERILEEVRRFVGDAAPHDDMTLVVLKVVPEEARA